MEGKKTSDISIYRKFDIQYFDTSKFRYTIFRYIETWIRYPTLLKIVAVDHSCKIADYVARAPRERYGVCPSCYLFVDIYRGEKKLNKGVGKGVLPYLHLRVLVHTFLLLPVYLSVYLVVSSKGIGEGVLLYLHFRVRCTLFSLLIYLCTSGTLHYASAGPV